MRNFYLVLLIAFSLVISINSQDRHYWDQAVGGRTALLGGIAVGGVLAVFKTLIMLPARILGG